MSVEFYEENQFNKTASSQPGNKNSSSLSKWLISNAIVKTEKGANQLILTVAIIFFVASGIILALGGNKTDGNTPDGLYIEDISPDQSQNLSPEYLNSLPSRNEKNI